MFGSVNLHTSVLAKGIVASAIFTAAAEAAPVLVDFDNLPGGGTLTENTVLNTQYASLGVTFSAYENSALVSSVVIDDFVPAVSVGHSGLYWVNTTSNSFGPRHDVLKISFAGGASGVSLYVQAHGNSSITFAAYNASAALLESISATTPSGGNFTLVSFGASNIAYIEALQPNDEWGWGLDNLSFELIGVPAPGALALLGLGLLGAGVARSRWLR